MAGTEHMMGNDLRKKKEEQRKLLTSEDIRVIDADYAFKSLTSVPG